MGVEDEEFQYWLRCPDCNDEHGYNGPLEVGETRCESEGCGHPLRRHVILSNGGTSEGEFELPRFR